MQFFLLFTLLPALGLCMVTPQAGSNKRKRTTELDIVESPVPAEQVTTSDEMPSDEPRIDSLAEDDDISPMEIDGSLLSLQQFFNDEGSLDNGSPSVPVPAAMETLPAELLTDADGPVSNVASFLDAEDFDNLMHSSKALRKSSFFYSKKEFRIPFDATEADVHRMLPFIQRVKKVTIGFNLNHLTILRECPKLRYLIVEQPNPGGLNEATFVSFINALSTFGNLASLRIQNEYANWGVDIAPLATLTQLNELGLDFPGLVNITALSAMTKLIKLTLAITGVTVTTLASTGVTDLSPLSALTHLKELTINGRLVDLTPLISLKGLTKLDLSSCYDLTVISPLEQLTELTELDIP
jgi:hypothetical protein